MTKNFLFVNDFVKPIRQGIKSFQEIKSELDKHNSDIITKSLFAYLVSKFEIMLNETLRIYLLAFPGSIDDSAFKLSKSQMLQKDDDLMESIVSNYIVKLSYDNINSYMRKVCVVFSIDNIEDSLNDEIIEIKETRNLLLHNDLEVNEIYLAKSGKKCRYKKDNSFEKEKLPLDKPYVLNAISVFCAVSNDILSKLLVKYKKYTKIKAMKEIWDYLFQSLILKFDDYWEHDDTYLFWFKLDIETLEGRISVGYSSTEALMLFFLLMQYNDSLVESYLERYGYRFLGLNKLYGQRKEKYLYLQEILTKYPDLFQQDFEESLTYRRNL